MFALEALARGWTVLISRLDLGDPLPQLGNADCLLVFGGLMGVWPIWACCLLLAAGGTAVPLQVGDPPRLLREVGFGAVSWWPKPQHMPLLQGLDPHELVLHWHGDRCLLPASAQILALSLHCPEQAFCLSPSA